MSRLGFIYNGVLLWNTGILVGVQKLAGLRTTKVDLQGRFVTPGFIDSHVHFIHGGLQVSIEGDSRSGFVLHASAAESRLRREDVQHAQE
jgi:predicted amidohydrolase YtcJ